MFTIILCIILLSILPGPSYSFNAKEHYSISNIAFMVSLIHAKNSRIITEDEEASLKSCFAKTHPNNACSITEHQADPLKECIKNKDYMNYGCWSVVVDNVRDPSILINLYALDKEEDRKVNCDKTEKRCRHFDEITTIEGLMAARTNQDHFQGRTLAKFKQWHDLAQVYAVNGNLAIALFLNAFATHYIEDFFAPGHLFTPRSEVNNISALALHNRYNKLGATMRVKTNKELKIYLALIEDICGDKEGGVKAISDLKENGIIRLYGDDDLTKIKGARELIISEVAKSITAIFKAYKNGKISKPLDFDYVDEFEPAQPSNLSTGTRHAYETKDYRAMFDVVSYKPMPQKPLIDRFVPILEITPYLSTPLKQGSDARFGVEWDLATYVTRKESSADGLGVFPYFQIGAAFGWDTTFNLFKEIYYPSWTVVSHGPFVKYIFDVENTDIGFSFYAKWKFNDENGKKFNSIPFGGRISLGLDFFSLFIGLGNELRFTDKKEKENVTTIYTGFTIHLPWETIISETSNVLMKMKHWIR